MERRITRGDRRQVQITNAPACAGAFENRKGVNVIKKCIYARCKRDIPEDAAYCPYCGRKQTKAPKRRSNREKGTGSVYKLSGNRRKPWVATYKGKSLGRMYATRAEAEAALDAVVSIRRPELYAYTLEDVYNAWSEVAYRDMIPNTSRGYQLAWSRYPPELRSKLARDVRSEDIQAVVDEMQEARGLSETSGNGVKFLYSKLCAWMMQRDLINKNYAKFVSVRKTEHRPTVLFTAEEVAKIYALANDPEQSRLTQTAMLCMIFLFTGMRISELFLLQVDNVHLDADPAYIQGGVKTPAGKDRIIPIYNRILPYFRFFASRATGELLISGFDGNHKPNGWRARDYAKMLEYLGIPYRVPHNTRKTMATNAAQSGIDQIALAKLMGWTDIDVGARYYIAPDAAYLADEMDKLAAWDVLDDS